MGVVAEVADDVVVMNRAKVVEHGPAVDIFENPAEPYTQALLASVPRSGRCRALEPAPFELVEYDSVSAGTPLVEVRDLCKHFPVGAGATVHAVENVSLQVGRERPLPLLASRAAASRRLLTR